MRGDEVLEQVHAVREAHAARFGFDLHAILADLRKREPANGRVGDSPEVRRAGDPEPMTEGQTHASQAASAAVDVAVDRLS